MSGSENGNGSMETVGTQTFVATLPSGAVVEMRGWSLGYNLSEVGKRGSEINRLISLLNRCIVKVHNPGPYKLDDSNRLDWLDVAECDMNAALIAARIPTLGSELVFKQRCPHHRSDVKTVGKDVLSWKELGCPGYVLPIEDRGNSEQTEFSVHLDNVLENHLFEMPPETVAQLATGENRFETELDGVKIVFSIATGRVLAKASKRPSDAILAGLPGIKDLPDEAKALAWGIACQLISLEDGNGVVEGSDAIYHALLSDRFQPGLVHAFGALKYWTGGIDSEMVVACNKCGWMPENEEGTMDLPFAAQPQFFGGQEKRLHNQPKRRKRRVAANG